jgi:KamA family protein
MHIPLNVVPAGDRGAVPTGTPDARSSESGEKILYYTNRKLLSIPQLAHLSPELVKGIQLASLVFPFKVNSYVLENLIDWRAGPDDPMFRLTFPHPDMLSAEDLSTLERLQAAGDERALAAAVGRIRTAMNPHSSDQKANLPIFNDSAIEGVQHKYDETALFFPKQGQTCHAYCTFCFRWPQFVMEANERFQADDADPFYAYLREHSEITDILMTGGDPMVMNSRRLAAYLEPLLAPELSHIRNIRIGTKALSYHPARFLQGDDSAELTELITRLSDAGRHVAVMAHVNHWRELEPEPVHEAVYALRKAGATIRTQSPVLRHVNDDPAVWRRNWSDQISMGMIPYYMFVERDTGANHYFGIPLTRALSIFQQAMAGMSGLGRTARGPVMSAGPGKVHVMGRMEIGGQEHFVLSFLQAREKEWLHKPFLADYSETAAWLSDLRPSEGKNAFFFEEAYKKFLSGKGSVDHFTTLKTVVGHA